MKFTPGITGIIGPNGSGKSTLCRIIAGIARPDSGIISFEGRNLRALSPVERAGAVSFVAQELPGGEGFSLLDFVTMGFYRFSREYQHKGRKTALRALEEVDLLDRAEQLYDSLSGGEKRRAVLARVLVQDSAVVILDEPASFLDYGHSRVMVSVLLRIVRENKKVVVIVSHDCDFLSMVCDWVLGLQNGQVRRMGRAKELLRDPGFLEEIYGVPFRLHNERIIPDFG